MEGGSTGRPLRRRNATVASRNAALLAVLVLLGSVPASSGEITPLAVPGVELAVGPGDIALSSSYIVAGDVPWVNTTVHNLGDTTANGTLQLFLGSPPSGAPFASVNFTVGADSTVTVPAQFNTAGLEGIRTVTARAFAVTPTEGGSLQNNEASAEARVHARFGEVNLAGTQTAFINTFYPRTAFVTVRDNATLTVGPLGNLSIGQLYANQFDLRVEGYGVLRISGGAVTANLPLRIVLADNATLIVEDASFVGVSIRSTTAGLMQFGSARLSAPELVVDGSTVALDGTDVQVDRADFSRVALTAQGASVAALAPITVRGASQAVLTNTRVSVASSFASPAQAEGAFPGISGYLGQLSVPFQPALHFTEASTGNFTRTSVDSTLAVAGTLHTSSVPILAEGGATVAFNRVARVTVTDPTGAPVPNATVDVFDYLVNDSLIVSALAADGVAQIELPSEFLENGAPHFVGTYYIQATRASASSPKVALTFALFPDLSAASLLSDLSIPLPLFAPWGLYAEDAPPVVYAADTSLSGEVLWTTDVQIHAALSLETADATLAQSRDFEHYVVVTDGGSLSANFSTIHSDFAFNLYILNGSSAQLTGTGLVRGNLLLFGAGTLALTDARVVGSAIGDAQSVASTNSFFWGRSVDLTAPEIHWQSTVAAAQQLVALQATNMTLVDVGLTGRFVPFDALNQTALSFGAFDALADDTFEGLLDAPAVRLSSPFLSAGPLTVWTQGALTVSAGPAGATVLRLRALVSSVQFQLSAVTLAINGINVPSGSALSFTGSGTALVQGIAAPRPSVGPGVTVVWYASVPVTVVDSFGLPVPGATVSAAPISGGGETPTALTDELGIATIDIPAITITSASSQTGPNYRLNATKDGATSVSISWDPESTESFTLTLPGSFAAVSGTSYFAVVAALSPSVNRVVASNVPDAASLAAFLEGHGIAPATLNFTATVFPGQAVEAYFAADYVYTQGSSATSRPMAGESVTFANDGVPAGTVVLDADGQALASFALPGSPGPHNLTATVPAGGLAAPLVATASYSLVDLPQLALVTSRIRTPVNASESIFVIGQVTYLDGSPAPFATITITYAPNKTRVNVTNEGGNYFVLLVAPASPGNYEITIVATRANARDSEPYSTPYTVQPAGGVKPPGLTQPFNYLPVVLGAAFFAVCMAVFAVALIQRRAARGEFVECGSCEKLTLATDKKCRHCGVEFETNLAKCSKCQAWIPSNVSECPQCHAVFSTQPEVGEKPTVTPSIAAPADFAAPITVPMAGRKTPPAQLEDLEFRLPGTTDTMDLGEKGSSPTFAATGGATPAPRPALNAAALSPDVPLERMGLPRHDEPASPVREVSSMEGGEPTRHDAVSLGTGNVDLSRTTAAATSTKSGAPDAPPDIDENVLRELLMKAAPELSDDVFPGDIRKELEEIARSEAPAAAERKSAAARGARTPPAPSPALDERPVEAPEKSRKSAFDVFQTPAKNIPVGYEKRGGSPGKDQAPKGGAPVCPNCGGNWVVQRDGKNSCRVCGTRW